MAFHHARHNRACVGLDPVTERLPESLRARHGDDLRALWRAFLFPVVECLAARAAAFKPNWAFFLAGGLDGMSALGELCNYLHQRAPEALLVLDMKVGDIQSTNQGYVRHAFDHLGADAVTVHPYLGSEALEPFLSRADRGVFVLGRTSNPGGAELQALEVSDGGAPEPLYLHLARRVAGPWNLHGNTGLVVGATTPEPLRRVRAVAPALPLLIPGVGAQGGDLDGTLRAAFSVEGAGPILVNQSSGILYADPGSAWLSAAERVYSTFDASLRAAG
ncbi:MAG: orotidine-5'-phosphate decarboxylase [Deltaproteobacteria bacterium]|nr:orotidine-5'-phosphate decarboxylase [Deltaproteobacteria bacterium]